MKGREAVASVVTIASLMGMAACGSPRDQQQPEPFPTPDSQPSATTAQPIDPSRATPKLGPAFEVPRGVQYWPALTWTQYGSGDRAMQAHFNFNYTATGQLVLGLYTAPSQHDAPTASVGTVPTPVFYYGCKDSYLMQIEDGDFVAVTSGPDTPFCQPVKRTSKLPALPSHAGLPDPQKLYGTSVLPIQTNITSGS